MPTCLDCGEYVEVEDWDNPVEWESHWCDGMDSWEGRERSKDGGSR